MNIFEFNIMLKFQQLPLVEKNIEFHAKISPGLFPEQIDYTTNGSHVKGNPFQYLFNSHFYYFSFKRNRQNY